MSTERVLQAALVAALEDDAAYTALVKGGVHDGDAPMDTVFPYTVVGDVTEVLNRTHDKDGYEYTVTVHDWSEYEGRRECHEIREARNAVLHNGSLTVTGWGLTKLTYEFGEILKDWDDDLKAWIRHQVTRYRTLSLET